MPTPGGETLPVKLHPLPRQAELPVWLTCIHKESYAEAGRSGLNVLGYLMNQTVDELAEKIAAYREGRRTAGLNPAAKTNTTAAATYDQFVGRLSGMVDDFVKTNKKSPSDDDLRKMTSSLLIQGSQAGAGWFGFSRSMPLFQSPDQSRFSPNVPDPDRAAIVKAYGARNQGKNPSDREISDIYMRGLLAPGRP